MPKISPHCDARPVGIDIDLIVLHAISLPAGRLDNYNYVIDLFYGTLDCNAHPSFSSLEGLRVSAHYLINRQGFRHCLVPLKQRAWHAGLSEWQGKKRCNDYSIGIEMIGDNNTPFTQQQYKSLAVLCHELINEFPLITPERIVAHSDIAPNRKWDPGIYWDWQRFYKLLRQ
ncbi:MAG: 1,6-anhydro-N-acetylmuramyl-L-alanine amidase AmpD [Mariprofundales bacterium]